MAMKIALVVKGRADLADTYRGGAHPLNATCSNVPEAWEKFHQIGDSTHKKRNAGYDKW